jgi:uncharacterized protein (TIGR00299 family) protein
MKALYFDVIGGVSGDMILGSLIDAGMPVETLRILLDGLNLSEFNLTATQVVKNGFRAIKVDVVVEKQPPERHLQEIREIILQSSLPPRIQNKSLEIFQKIAEVEATIHNQPLESVHLHELGGTDTIVDITGTLLALDHLGITQVYSSALPLGRGFIQGAHGEIPLPAPATLGLLKGLPVFGREIDAELVTPTGAALISSLAVDYGPIPPLKLETVGYGAGGRDLSFPNLLRVLIGELSAPGELKRLAVLETNLDDLNPEIISYVVNRLFEAGALDVSLHPIQMKKNRPGTQIQVLSEISDADDHRSILFKETTTLGIRQYLVDRYCLSRVIQEIDTPYGPIRIKIADTGGSQLKISPEYEDCARLANKHQVPLQQIYREAVSLYWEKNQK